MTVTPVDPVDAAREASRRIVRELGFLQDNYEEGGVTHAECHALIELGRASELTVGQLAETLRLDKSTVSRTLARLASRGLVEAAASAVDARKKPMALTAAGRRQLKKIDRAAGGRVKDALGSLRATEQEEAIRGLALYARALERSRLRREIVVRPIEPEDDAAVAALIRTVMPEFGARGPGFAINDPEVDGMSSAYRRPRHGYWVVERAGRVVGGGGFAPLEGGPRDTCELRKMYFLPEVRGLGLGEELIDLVLARAKRAGFSRCYLETLASMKAAQHLYEKKGFARLDGPKGSTGHFGCNTFYERAL